MITEARRIDATVVFCDLWGFTELFDNADPMLAFEFADSVLSTLAEAVEGAGGTVCKFTGDGLMAHFGVLQADPEHAKNACRAALAMKQAEVVINGRRHSAQQPVIAIGVGINSGLVAAGSLTLPKLREFTVYGDVVNTAARIEGLTRRFRVDILVSESTMQAVANSFDLMAMPAAAIRGKRGQHVTYWLLPTNI